MLYGEIVEYLLGNHLCVGFLSMGIKSRLCKYCFPEFISAAAIRRMSINSGIVLMYHEVLPDEISFPAWTVVKESDFRWQMTYLQKHFDILHLDNALERVKGQEVGEKPFAVITFDDGYKGNLDNVLPVMEYFGLPFIVYVSTKAAIDKCLLWFDRILNLLALSEDIHVELTIENKTERFIIPGKASEAARWKAIEVLLERLKRMTVDEREYWVQHIAEKYSRVHPTLEMLTTEGLQTLACSELVTVGSHTHGHELLDQLDDLRIQQTLEASIHHLIDITGESPQHFSYPNGNYNQTVTAKVQEMGFETAVTTNAGIWSESKKVMQIPRIGIGRFETKSQFRGKVSGYLR